MMIILYWKYLKAVFQAINIDAYIHVYIYTNVCSYIHMYIVFEIIGNQHINDLLTVLSTTSA